MTLELTLHPHSTNQVAMRNISNDEATAYFANISCTRTKIFLCLPKVFESLNVISFKVYKINIQITISDGKKKVSNTVMKKEALNQKKGLL